MGAPEAPTSFSGRTPANGRGKGGAACAGLSPGEARVRAIADIVAALISGVQQGQSVDLNNLKTEVGKGLWHKGD